MVSFSIWVFNQLWTFLRCVQTSLSLDEEMELDADDDEFRRFACLQNILASRSRSPRQRKLVEAVFFAMRWVKNVSGPGSGASRLFLGLDPKASVQFCGLFIIAGLGYRSRHRKASLGASLPAGCTSWKGKMKRKSKKVKGNGKMKENEKKMKGKWKEMNRKVWR